MTTASHYIQNGQSVWQMPRKMKALIFETPSNYRYLGAYGGRASAKTRSFCLGALARGMEKKRRILCAREYLNSIKDSSHAELCHLIEERELYRYYEYGDSYIVNKRNGTEFLYKGLRYSVNSVTSVSEIDICLVEEAENVSDKSWRKLGPSVRASGSQIWLAWNPEDIDSATRKRFVLAPPPESRIIKMNWRDNPWFSREMELERQHDLAMDQDMYNHVWEGECISRSDAKVYNGKWEVRNFSVPVDATKQGWIGPLYGLDFGFSNDPAAGVKVWIGPDNCLYIEAEAGRTQLELNDMPGFLQRGLSGCQHYAVRCDPSRPDSISYLSKHGIPKAVKAEATKIEDGVTFIRAYNRVYVHPRCSETVRELGRYSYAINKIGDILPDIVDKHNHYLDALRYALSGFIRVAKQKLNIALED